jgi:integrase
MNKYEPQYIYGGLRRPEALWLTPADLDWNREPALIRIRAKRIEDRFWQPKTGQERSVPVSTSLRPFLEAYRAAGLSGKTWLFPSPRGLRWHGDNFTHRLQALNQAAGLPWSCMDFRHTFGSQLAMKGESLYKISALMGNSPEVCRRHYVALVTENMADTVEFPRAAGLSPASNQEPGATR